eukprot:tig00000157_g9664.t1
MWPEFQRAAAQLADLWAAEAAGAGAAGGAATVDVPEPLSRMTIDVIGRAAFGAELRALEPGPGPGHSDPVVAHLLAFHALARGRPAAVWRRMQRMIYLREAPSPPPPLPPLPPTPKAFCMGVYPPESSPPPHPQAFDSRLLELLAALRFRAFRAELSGLKERTRRLARERRAAWLAGCPVPQDLLQLMVEARDEETGRGLTEDEIAGQETTAVLLGWTLRALVDHPHVQEKVHAEVAAVLKAGPGARPRAPELADFDRLKYTRCVLAEVLRLWPPAPSSSRLCLRDDRIGG